MLHRLDLASTKWAAKSGAIVYAVKRIGQVGIASDSNEGGIVAGWRNEGERANVTAELLRRAATPSATFKSAQNS